MSFDPLAVGFKYLGFDICNFHYSLKPPKYLRLIESGDFLEAKIRITHLESLVGGSKPFRS